MRRKHEAKPDSAEKTVRDIRRATRRPHAAEEKIRIVLEGLRGEESIAALCREYAVKAHKLLGCHGVSRTDFRWDDELGEDGLFVLETNTQPGMTPLSLVPEQARLIDMDYADIVEAIVAEAMRVHGDAPSGGGDGDD